MTIGQLVTPTLKLVRLIGRGGMGEVWAAENLTLGSLVAVKMLGPRYADDERSVIRFKQEAQRAARVRSPHVTTVFDYGVTKEGEPYIVMELLDGETLGQRIKRNGPLPVKEITSLIGQSAKALAAAHTLGVVHRDIKPDNIFIVDNHGEPFVKVVDFGIAKEMDTPPNLTGTGTMIGSPPYMSPEQYMAPKQVDLRTDLWSLGVVVYEALTGARPFVGETMMAVGLAVTKGEFKPPSLARIDAPWMLDAWMSKALAVDPDKRFRSAMEMVESLAFAMHSRPASAGGKGGPLLPITTSPLIHSIAPRNESNLQARKETPRPMAGQSAVAANPDLRFFEGTWISVPDEGRYYCRVVRDQLRIVYCYSGNDELSGEYYDCLINGRSLYARFRWPNAPDTSGYVVMHARSEELLVGGWWFESDVPRFAAADLSRLNAEIPGMYGKELRRARPAPPVPKWAEMYFASFTKR